jgi:pimeloyl-ACP methyl ester carboxylesterase
VTDEPSAGRAATYVLVHGGAHGGWCYQRVARRLRAAGHEVHAPTLTGLGERSHLLGPDVDLDVHITDVVNVLHYEDLQDVVLVGHSYGGTVITGVADRAGGRVGRLVYLDAAIPENGQSTADLLGNPEFPSVGRVVDGVELFLFPDARTVQVYGVKDPDDLAWMVERLTPHPWRSFAQPLRLTSGARLAAIPQYHIVCASTLARGAIGRLDNARAEGRLWSIDSGHDLMITAPQAVADALLEVLAR